MTGAEFIRRARRYARRASRSASTRAAERAVMVFCGGLLMQNAYPCVLTPEEGGGFSVSFPDVPKALTCGNDLTDALAMAEEALTAVLAIYLQLDEDPPSPRFEVTISSSRGHMTADARCREGKSDGKEQTQQGQTRLHSRGRGETGGFGKTAGASSLQGSAKSLPKISHA